MPQPLSGFRVFIASPGGLDQERRRFRRLLNEFNEDDAHERGAAFIPIGWELTLPGSGRPQALINEQVRQCDYLVLVLWDHWGSPPAANGPYSSGTEEEYAVARECLADTAMPMRDIVVLFKGVDTRQQSDPGEQLQKVLAFKRTLEEQKTLLFGTFDSLDGFERDVRRHLLRWIRDHHEKETSEHRSSAPAPPSSLNLQVELFRPPVLGEAEESSRLLEIADQLVDEGRLTEAESVFAKAVVARTDVVAMTKYTRFLRRTGRTDLALAMSERLLEVSQELDDARSEVEALSNIAILRRNEGELDQAVTLLSRALEAAERLGTDGATDRAFLYDNVGLTLRRQGNTAGALENYEKALRTREGTDDQRGVASTSNNIGVVLRQVGRLDEAEARHQIALKMFEDLDYRRGIAITRGYLGEVYEAQGRLDDAQKEYQQALELDEVLKSPRGTSINLCQLGRVALLRGNLDEALEYAAQALGAGEEFGNREGIAGALHLFGRIEAAGDELELARQNLESAVSLYRELDHQLAVAWTLSDLGRVMARLGQSEDARAAVSEAKALAGSLYHSALNDQVRAALESVEAAEPAASS